MSDKKKVSDKDKNDWEDFLKNPTKIFDKEKNLTVKQHTARYKFDLHGYSLDNANRKVKEIIESCYTNGYSEILIITGKGYHSKVDKNVYVSKDHSTLRGTVPDFIKNDSYLCNKINKISIADLKNGGEGALYIYLKKEKKL